MPRISNMLACKSIRPSIVVWTTLTSVLEALCTPAGHLKEHHIHHYQSCSQKGCKRSITGYTVVVATTKFSNGRYYSPDNVRLVNTNTTFWIVFLWVYKCSQMRCFAGNVRTVMGVVTCHVTFRPLWLIWVHIGEGTKSQAIQNMYTLVFFTIPTAGECCAWLPCRLWWYCSWDLLW